VPRRQRHSELNWSGDFTSRSHDDTKITKSPIQELTAEFANGAEVHGRWADRQPSTVVLRVFVFFVVS